MARILSQRRGVGEGFFYRKDAEERLFLTQRRKDAEMQSFLFFSHERSLPKWKLSPKPKGIEKEKRSLRLCISASLR
jgi:hypothetical protein